MIYVEMPLIKNEPLTDAIKLMCECALCASLVVFVIASNYGAIGRMHPGLLG